MTDLFSRPVPTTTRSENRTAAATDTAEWYKVFPWRGRFVARWLAAWAVLSAIYVAVGLFYTRVMTGVVDAETQLSIDVVPERSADRTDWALWGSFLSDTIPKVVAIVVLTALFAFLWKRWHDGFFLASTLLLEVSVFGFAARVVGRDRPPIEQLDGAPTQSFPSGHAAASVAFYVSLFLIVTWHTRATWIRGLFAVVAVLAPAIVIASRFYLGMHYVSDLIAGALLGAAAVVIMRRLVGDELSEVDPAQPERLHRLPIPDQPTPV